MTLRIRVATCIGILAALATPDARAYFQDAAAGARPAAMGEAYVAVADDPHALLFNPSGLARIPDWQFSALYADLYAGLNPYLFNGQRDYSGYHDLAFAYPLPENGGTLAAGWTRLYSAFYWENTWSLAYARRLLPAWNLDTGVTFKGLQWGVTENQYTSDSDLYPARQKLGWTCDAGLLATPYPGVDVGFSAENIRPVDMGLSVEDRVPFQMRIGAAYTWSVAQFRLDDVRTALEVERRSGRTTPKLGAESRWFKKAIAVRAGINSDSASGGFGLLLHWPSLPLTLRLDYAFTYPFEVSGTLGSHRLEMTVAHIPAAPVAPAKAEVLGPWLPPDFPTQPLSGAAETTTVSAKPAEVVPPRSGLGPENIRKGTVVIGYESSLLSESGNVQNLLWAEEKLEKALKSKTGLNFVKVGFNKPKELMDALALGELDIVIASDGVFKQAYRQGLAAPYLTYVRGGRDSQRFCLVVLDNHSVGNLADLAHARLGFLRWDSLALLKSHFYKNISAYKSENFFREIRPLKQTRDAVVALQLSDVDVVLAPEDIVAVANQMHGDILIPLKVLATSPAIPNTPVLIRTSTPPAKASDLRKLRGALLDLHASPEGRAFLKFFGIQKLVLFPEKRFQADARE